MAFITDHFHVPAALNFRGFFQSLGKSIDLAASSRARVDQMERLNSKSDEQLEEMGIRRDEIARYVFRDILYL